MWEETNETLLSQLNEKPELTYESLGLCIDGEQIPINTEKSIVNINGREYWSKEMATKLLSSSKSYSIKDNILYIGKIFSNATNLYDQHVNSCNNGQIQNRSFTDSYGNSHSNAYINGYSYTSNITFVLNEKYSYLKLSAVMLDNCDSRGKASFTVKADDVIVYSSDSIGVETEPFSVEDISINNCKLLTIEINNEYLENKIAIYDAVVYNADTNE